MKKMILSILVAFVACCGLFAHEYRLFVYNKNTQLANKSIDYIKTIGYKEIANRAYEYISNSEFGRTVEVLGLEMAIQEVVYPELPNSVQFMVLVPEADMAVSIIFDATKNTKPFVQPIDSCPDFRGAKDFRYVCKVEQ